ncbi:MAG: hypothetical protein ACO1RX_10875 [Candidatus Sericytochromatia bacterium]
MFTPLLSRLSVILLSLSLLACAGESTPSLPTPAQPSASSSSSSSPEGPMTAPSFHWRYTLAAPGKGRVSKGGLLLKQTENGAIFGVGNRQIGDQQVLAISHFSSDGLPLWSKALFTESSFNVGEFALHGDALYVTGSFRITPNPAKDFNLNLRNVVVIKLNLKGEVQWSKVIAATPFSKAFTNEIGIFPLGPDRLGVKYHSRLYLLSTSGDLFKGLDFRGTLHDIQPTATGEWIASHRVVPETSGDWSLQGFQLTALDSELNVKWQKYYASDLKGLLTLSKLHLIGPDRIHMSFGINDTSFNSKPGVVHLFLNAQGEVQKSFADLATLDQSGQYFTAIKSSSFQDGHIYLSVEQGSGRGNPVYPTTWKYSAEGEIQHMRIAPLLASEVYQNRLLLPLSGMGAPDAVNFEIAANPVTQDFCRETPLADIARDDTFRVQVSTDTLDPVALPSTDIRDFEVKENFPLTLLHSKGVCSRLL